ncbi:hypothetical protein D3C71_720770 [compost metagenome]
MHRCHAKAARRFPHRLRNPGKADHRVGNHRQQRIEKQRHEGGRHADAGNADLRCTRDRGRDPSERRDQQTEKGDGGDGLDDIEGVQHPRPQPFDLVTEDAERNTRDGRRDQRADGKLHVPQGRGPEYIGPAGIFLDDGEIVPEAACQHRRKRGHGHQQQ